MSATEPKLLEAFRVHQDLDRSPDEISQIWHEAEESEKAGLLDRLLMETLLVDALREKKESSAHGGEQIGQVVSPGRLGRPMRIWAAAAVLLVAVGAAAYLGLGRVKYPVPELTGDFALTSAAGDPLAREAMSRGDRLTAGPKGAQLSLGGYCRIRLEASTRLVLEGEARKEVVRLTGGEIHCQVDRDHGEFTVQTPRGSLTVVGTEFVVKVEHGGMKGGRAMGKVKSAAVTVIVMSGIVGYQFGDSTGRLTGGMSQVFGGELKKIAAGAPRYMPKRGHSAWKEKGRIVGLVRDCPGCEIDALDATGKRVIKSIVVKPGDKAYELEWLLPGTYTLRVAAKGYETLVVERLEVKTDNDLRVDLEFEGEGGKGAKKIGHGKPRYLSKRGHAAWKDKGRFVGLARSAPEFEAEVLNSSGRVVANERAEALKDGKRAYEVWLEPGTYTLRVVARGYDPLVLENLVVKVNNDLRIDLEF